MHYDDRTTVCVSTQAGCAMACGFCATGQAGFARHLSVGEIVEQVVRARQRAGPATDPDGSRTWCSWGWASRWPTTTARGRRSSGCTTTWASRPATSRSRRSGVVPGIRRLATEALPVNLAVSLHAANDELRDAARADQPALPAGRARPRPAPTTSTAKGRRLSFEWALIDGVNDRPVDAAELAAFARPLRAHVNLIPLNPTPGYPVRGTPPGQVRGLPRPAAGLGVNATVRRNRGTDIDAACGQLRALHAPPSNATARTTTVELRPPSRMPPVRPDLSSRPAARRGPHPRP